MRQWIGLAAVLGVLACGGTSAPPDSTNPPTQTVAHGNGAVAVAKLDGTSGTGVAPDTEKFDGSASFSKDPAAKIVVWAWDFGDGTGGNGEKISHTFAAGTFTVTLKVIDSDGEAGTSSLTVIVTPATSGGGSGGDGGSGTPKGVSAVIQFDGTTGKGTAPDTEGFDGSASHSLDPTATISSCTWDFGDGGAQPGCKVKHTFEKAGTFTVTLTAKDTDGSTGTAKVQVVVSAPPPGTTRWVINADGAVATDFNQRAVLASGSVLAGIDLSAGKLAWSSDHGSSAYLGAPIFLSPQSEQVLGIEYDWSNSYAQLCGYSSTNGSVQNCYAGISLNANGFYGNSMSGTGELAWAVTSYNSPWSQVATVLRLDGTMWSVQLSPSPGGAWFSVNALAAEPGGDLLVSGTAGSGYTIGGTSVGSGEVLMRLDSGGNLVWWMPFPVQAQMLTSAAGTVVGILQKAQIFSVGGQTYAPGTYLTAIEKTGKVRWLIPLARGFALLSVLPTGQVAAFVDRDGCGGPIVYRYDLAGKALWNRDFADQHCNLNLESIAILPGDVLVTGTVNQATDLGTGSTTSGGFTLDLRG